MTGPGLAVVVRYGVPGYVGRFATDVEHPRGTAVVVRTPRGVELGTVLGDAAHAQALHAAGGELLRVAGPDDVPADPARLLHEATALAAGLPLAVADAEVLLHDSAGVVHAVVWGGFDGDRLFAELSARVGYPVGLLDLGTAGGPADPPEPGCNSCGTGGGCGSGSGGGCGSCSRGAVRSSADDLTAYFAGLRQQMEARVSLN